MVLGFLLFSGIFIFWLVLFFNFMFFFLLEFFNSVIIEMLYVGNLFYCVNEFVVKEYFGSFIDV